jgi:penicillin-binding protein 1C
MTIPPDNDPQKNKSRRTDTASETSDSGLTKAQAPQNSQTIAPGGAPSRRHVPPALDKDGIPLPQRVHELDLNATSVTPAAYQVNSQQRPPLQTGGPSETRPRSKWRKARGCLLRGLIVALFVTVALTLIAATYVIYTYYSIASTLPSVEDLQAHASQFETARIYDRKGKLLYELNDPNAGRRTYVPLNKISPEVVAATIATEDQNFYSHPGFDLTAIARAFWQNANQGGIVSGASTITQQLARTLLLSPEERTEQSYMRKVREAILAAEITRRYSKDDILELYLNEAYYGNLAYGIEAAAETYFQTTADRLTFSQAAFLGGLPQSPAIYDIHTNREDTLNRMRQVLVLMFQLSQDDNCIFVSNSPHRVCVSAPDAVAASQEIEAYNFPQPNNAATYPHWVQYVREQLEKQFGAQAIYRSGFSVYTTLDSELQDTAQALVTQQVANIASQNVKNGALVAMDPATGEILAMVGSPNFYDDVNAGQINMATSATRQPGSSIKPINYVAAFEKGWTPSTMIWDVPIELPPSGDPNDPREPYKPVNYDGKYHGAVTVRTALANSYNIPAVRTLDFVGVYDDPDTPQKDGMIGTAERLGITSLTRDDYGLSLTLGGGEVSLLDMTGAFSVFANGGKRVPPVSILEIRDFTGQQVYEYKPAEGEQVIRPEHAYLITSILSDNQARAPMFGTNSLLNLPFPVAAKTGTSNDFRDNWTLGYTPDLATGVWIGNADYSPMVNTTGLSGAAPIWSQFMQYAVPHLTGGAVTPFIRPDGIMDRVVCQISGTDPSDECPSQYAEVFASDQPPASAGQDLWRKMELDTWSGYLASEACGSDFRDRRLVINSDDEWAIKWLTTREDGENWAFNHGWTRPFYFNLEKPCGSAQPRPKLSIMFPAEGQTVTTNPLDIYAVVDATNGFQYYTLDYGIGENPGNWGRLVNENPSPAPQPAKIYTMDMTNIPPGVVTLKLRMKAREGENYAEKKVRFLYQPPTPMPTSTPTVTLTPIPPPTSPPTWTPVPPTSTPTDTPSPTPTDTPVPTP